MNSYNRLLLIENDNVFRNALIEQLKELPEFEEIVETPSGKQGIKYAFKQEFGVIIISLGLDDITAQELCEVLRSSNLSSLILVIGSSNSSRERFNIINSGADDFFTKPIKLSFLIKRLRRYILSKNNLKDEIFIIGKYKFQPAFKFLKDPETNRVIRLTEKENSILIYLNKLKGRIVSREKLLNEVWGYNQEVNTHTLETHVYRLRRKIESDPSNAKFLITESGGYCLRIQ